MTDPSLAHEGILLVDDDPATLRVLRSMLKEFGDVRFATSGWDALRLARERVPSLVLLDADMPGMSGFDVCGAFRSDPGLANVPIIFVSSHAEFDAEMTGLAMGAVDYITKPPRGPLLTARVNTHLRLKRSTDALRQLASLDGLTGLANRAAFDTALRAECVRAERSASTLGLLMIDVDHFKKYNDHYGHPAGDQCLRQLAAAMLACAARPNDLVARYGGEEFAVVLPNADRHGASQVARRLLDTIGTLAIPHAKSACHPHVTVSIGIACLPARQCTTAEPGGEAMETSAGLTLAAQHLLEAADRSLYEAKARGRARFALDGTNAGDAAGADHGAGL